MGKKYGYVRVSTREQNEDRQLYSMQESGVEKKTSLWTNSLAAALSAPVICG